MPESMSTLMKKMLVSAELSAGHARALLNAPNPLALARQVVKKGLNVRQAERLVRKKQRQEKAPTKAEKKDVDTVALERDLSNLLGLKVAVKFKGGGGSLTVHYGSLEQLDDVLRRLSQGGKAIDVTHKPAAKPEKKKPAKRSKPKLSIGVKSAKPKKKRARP